MLFSEKAGLLEKKEKQKQNDKAPLISFEKEHFFSF